MKTPLLKLIFATLFLVFLLGQKSYGQFTFTANTSGVGSTTIFNGQTGIVLYGFNAVQNSGSSKPINRINLTNTNNNQGYFTNARLVYSTNGAYSTSNPTIGTTNFYGGNVDISNISFSLASGTTYSFFLVADMSVSYGTIPNTLKFNLDKLINEPTGTTYSNSTTAATDGTSYSLSLPALTYALATTGVNPSTTVYNSSTGIVYYGLTVGSNINTTINNPILTFQTNQSNNVLGLFSNVKLYMSTTGNGPFGTGSSLIASGATQSGANIIFSPSAPISIPSSSPITFYFVADLTYSNAGLTFPTTFTIKLSTITGSASNYTNNTANTTSPTYNFIYGNLSIADNNTAPGAEITPGVVSYGQTDIVLFSYAVTAQGNFTVTKFSIACTQDMNQLLNSSTAKLYVSSTPNFANAQQVPGASFVFSADPRAVQISSLSQQFTSATSTTKYYFVVADFNQTISYTNPGTFQYNFTSGQSLPAVTATNLANTFTYSGTSYTTANGKVFTIVNTYDWVGGASGAPNSWTNLNNFHPFNSGAAVGALPNGNITVYIGRIGYNQPPIITAPTTVGGITFGSAQASVLTISDAAVTLTINNNIQALSNSTSTINGPGKITVINNATPSTLALGSTFNLAAGTTLTTGAPFNMSSTSILNLIGNSSVVNTSTFTLKSDANGSAVIGPLTGTSALTGTYQVQRYVIGGSANRGYRLFSSPVNDATVGSNKVYDLAFLKNTAFITGTAIGNATNGMDNTAVANPTIYLYRENIAPSNSGFIAGNFRGVNAINNATAINIGVDGEPSNPYNLPIGNGFMFFYRGDRSAATFAQETVSTYVPTAATFTNSGFLNQGDVIVRNWNTPTVNTLSYTNSGLIANSAVRGFTLVGNPYASSIDWDNYLTSTATTGALPKTDISNTIYLYNVKLKGYSVYQAGNGGLATSKASNQANIIPSGQGFFIKATSASAALKFTEAAKVNTQVAIGNLLMSAGAVPKDAPLQYMRVQLFKDTVNYDDGLVFFKDGAKTDYVMDEDAAYLRGNNTVALSMRSSDNIALAINRLELPKKDKQVIPLNVTVATTGIYQLNLPEIKNIPPIYQVWLMDAYKKDSLDLRQHPSYNFNAITTNAATFGANRFTVVIRQDPNMALRLLDFSALKATTGAQLLWVTENESNYTNFTVERSTDGGKTFEVVGGLASSGLGKYTLLDKAPVIGLNQYRLKQDDINGTITYSKVVNLMYSNTSSNIIVSNITVYPNPATSFINVDIVPQENTTTYNIKITNGVGNIVKSATVSQTTWQANVSNLLPGTYFVQVLNNTNKNIIGNSKFVKN